MRYKKSFICKLYQLIQFSAFQRKKLAGFSINYSFIQFQLIKGQTKTLGSFNKNYNLRIQILCNSTVESILPESFLNLIYPYINKYQPKLFNSFNLPVVNQKIYMSSSFFFQDFRNRNFFQFFFY